jgi:hypothetical protein
MTFAQIAVVICVLVTVASVLIWDLIRRHRIKREDRNSCSFCGCKATKRRHLRVQLSLDSLPAPFTRFFSQPDMLCQTQKKCSNNRCMGFDIWLEEKTRRKYFNPFRQFFHSEKCRPNARPEDFLGYWRKKLTQKEECREHINFRQNIFRSLRSTSRPPPFIQKSHHG